VNPATTLGQLVVSSASTAPSFATTALEEACTTLLSGKGVQCPVLNAYGYDTWGNTLSNSNSQACTTWTKVNNDTTTASYGTSETVETTLGGHTLTRKTNDSTPAVDERVRCVTGAVTSNTVRIYGGPAKLRLTMSPTSTLTDGATPLYTVSGTSLLAGYSNFTLGTVSLRSMKAGVEVAMPGLNASTQQIDFTNQTLTANTFGTDANTAAYVANITNCAFDSGGACYPAANMNFRKLESAAGKFRVTVRGVSADVQIPKVDPGAAADLEITGMPAGNTYSVDSYATASSVIAVTVNTKDEFGNTTTSPGNGAANCDLAVSGNDPGPFADSITYGTQPSSTANLKIYKAKTHRLVFSKCGVSKSQDLTITAGTTRRTMLTATNTQPVFNCAASSIDATQECALTRQCLWTLDNQSDCGTLFAWEFDKAGNPSSSSTTCNSSAASRTYAAVAGTSWASSTPQWDNSLAQGFKLLPETNKVISGDLICTATAGHLGGTKLTFSSSVASTITMPTPECTPWIYIAEGRALSATTASNPYALCQFTNNTGNDLTTINISLGVLTDGTQESAPTVTWTSWTNQTGTNVAIANNGIGQFVIRGQKGFYSQKFNLGGSTPSASILVNNSSDVRVPTRLRTTTSANNQYTALLAATALTYAGKAEPDGTAQQTYDGISSYRRAGFAVTLSSATTFGGTAITLSSVSTSQNVSIDIYDLGIGNPGKFNMQSASVLPWSTTNYFSVSNTSCNSNQQAQSNTCQIQLGYSSTNHRSGLRGVFIIRDNNTIPFYFMTEPLQ
ncbi:MAG: hypothetical protein RIR26_2149, partial [Pseudomonadota bacterium]